MHGLHRHRYTIQTKPAHMREKIADLAERRTRLHELHRRRHMNAMNRVLIVDDDDAGRHALSICLASFGYEPTEAADGMEALIRLQTGAYALVITDYRMAGLNGIELLQIVR